MHAVHELHIYIELRYLKHKLVVLPEKQTSEIVPIVTVLHISVSVFSVLYLLSLFMFIYVVQRTIYRSRNRHVPLNCSNPFYYHTLRGFQETNEAIAYIC